MDQAPPSTDEAVLAWMESLREGQPAVDQPLARVDSAGIHPVSSVRAAARRIEGQMAGGSPPSPDQDLLLRTRYGGHPRGAKFEAAPARVAAPPAADNLVVLRAAAGSAYEATPLVVVDSDQAMPSGEHPATGVEEPSDELHAPSEDDVVPELPEYGDEYSDEDGVEGRYEASEGVSEPQSEPVCPARPFGGSQSAPVTPARSAKKGWSFGRMFSSSKRRKGGGEGIEDGRSDALPAARSISAGDLGASLSTPPRKKKGGRFSRMFGRKRQVSHPPSRSEETYRHLHATLHCLLAAQIPEMILDTQNVFEWPLTHAQLKSCPFALCQKLKVRRLQVEDAFLPASVAGSVFSIADTAPARRNSFSAALKKRLHLS